MDRPELTPIHEPERSVNPVPRRLSDPSAARELIGFQSSIGVEDGLRELVAWWQVQVAEADKRGAA
jgi:UDP-glucose 4-epimerase